jgi:hypothetical protein
MAIPAMAIPATDYSRNIAPARAFYYDKRAPKAHPDELFLMEIPTNASDNLAGKVRQSLLTGDNEFKVWVLILQASDIIYRLRNKELRRFTS